MEVEGSVDFADIEVGYLIIAIFGDFHGTQPIGMGIRWEISVLGTL